ncbi:RagB/SusD family nutrient uptake outer membrane protein [Hymenobacter qilianensis]|nr:RagB/SusD family nutrient uptake outer membrane protein [Hymenobacter qilianensis]
MLALTSFLALGLGACEVTDLEPQDSVAEGTAFEDAAKVNLSVAGLYNAAQSGFYDPLNGTALAVRGYPFGAAATELDDIRGEDVVDLAGFFGIVYANTITPSSPNVVNMWSTLYALINQSNVVIEGVRAAGTKNLIPAPEALAFEGEARFLRALAYHELLLHFAKPYADGQGSAEGVPVRDFAINSTSTLERARVQGRNTVAEGYTLMLEDLKFAEENLPATRTGGIANKVTRATKGAAIALRQRLLLHQGNYAGVVTEGAKLIAGTTAFTSPIGSYALTATPLAAFPGIAGATVENIFSIENSSDDNPGVNGALPSFFGSNSPAPVGIGGRGLIAVSPVLYNSSFWTCTDLRRTQLLQMAPTRYFSFKYRDVATGSDFAPIIRYAEVLLNQAEAQARLGKQAEALALLNAVRNRAVTTVADQYTAASFANQTSLIQAILNERRVEFVAEGFRWDDIHRLIVDPTFKSGGIPRKFSAAQTVMANYKCGTPVTVTGSVAPIPYTDPRFLWPIPSVEIANNPNIAQNPGY